MHGLIKLNGLYGVSRIDLKDFIYSNLRQVGLRTRSHSLHYLKVASLKSGRKLSKYVASLKRNNTPTEVVCDYLKHLKSNVIQPTVNKIEPSIIRVLRLWTDNGWEYIDMIKLGMSENSNKLFGNFQPLHNLHRSVTEPSMVAYYPSLRHMREGREVKTRLGKYLTTYKNEFNLSESDIKTVVEGFNGFLNSQSGWVVSFIDHDDEQGWVNAYSDGSAIRSCMTGETAVRVYAHSKSVLKLAILKNAEGSIIARSIVRDDDRKGYLRVYPAPDNAPEGRFLRDHLCAVGYKNEIDLDGCLLQAIESGHGGYVAPYIDSGRTGTQKGELITIDGVSYIEVGSGYLDLAMTGGVTDEMSTCADCGEGMADDDSTYIEYHDHSVCQSCADDNYTYAYTRGGQGDIPNDRAVRCETDSDYYDIDYLHEYDIFECEYDELFYHLDEIVECDGGFYYVGHCVRLDHEHDDNRYCFKEFAHTLSDGSICHSDDAETLQNELNDSYEAESPDHNPQLNNESETENE